MENLARNQATDLRQSSSYAKFVESIGWKVVRVEGLGQRVQVFIKPLGIFGAIAKIQRSSLPLPWDKIQPTLKRHRVWLTKLEPLAPSSQFTVLSSQLKRHGFRQDGWPLLATKTLRIDLRPPLPKIAAGFKKDARYCLRKSQLLTSSVQKNGFDGFYGLWKKAATIKHLWIPPKKDLDNLVSVFGDDCFCITVDDLAGAVVLIHDRTAYYYYAAALPAAKQRYLPYLVAWECIKEAKKRQCAMWDWEGVYDDRWPNKGWRGFSHFKKAFGGSEVSFPGSFTRWSFSLSV